MDRAFIAEDLDQAIHERHCGLVAVARHQPFPALGLGGLHPRHQVLRVKGVTLVIARVVAHLPATRGELLDDVALEVLLAVASVGVRAVARSRCATISCCEVVGGRGTNSSPWSPSEKDGTAPGFACTVKSTALMR